MDKGYCNSTAPSKCSHSQMVQEVLVRPVVLEYLVDQVCPVVMVVQHLPSAPVDQEVPQVFHQSPHELIFKIIYFTGIKQNRKTQIISSSPILIFKSTIKVLRHSIPAQGLYHDVFLIYQAYQGLSVVPL